MEIYQALAKALGYINRCTIGVKDARNMVAAIDCIENAMILAKQLEAAKQKEDKDNAGKHENVDGE